VIREFRVVTFLTLAAVFAIGCERSAFDELEANKKLVSRFIISTNEQDFAAYDELLSSDMQSHFPGGDARDREQFEDGEREFAVAFPDISRTIEDLIAEDDKVVARTSLRGTHLGDFLEIPATGRPIQITALAVYRIADGRIAEAWIEADFIGLMSQINGADPQDR